MSDNQIVNVSESIKSNNEHKSKAWTYTDLSNCIIWSKEFLKDLLIELGVSWCWI